LKRGPKPKPYLVKLAEGFPGHRKCNPGILPPTTHFEPPFSLDGLARAEWDRLMRVAFWLRETEAVAIGDRCLCFQRVMEAEEIVSREGMTIQGSRGEVTHPALRMARDYRAAMQRWDLELGLMPSSRLD
jgi:P27 family predicted phage terminase small subunit